MRVVTIDGPAGAGKSTVARTVAERLGWRFLDTGAMYRAVTLAALRRGVDLERRAEVAALARSLRVELPPGRVLLDGEDVSDAIRTRDVTGSIRHVADNPEARAVLNGWQRAFAAAHDTITEGRDQGTVVFPDALCKLFLTASLDERARRRREELEARGEPARVSEIRDEIRRRDERDRARAVAPLAPAPDAIEVDTTGLPLEAVIGRVLELVTAALSSASEEGRPIP